MNLLPKTEFGTYQILPNEYQTLVVEQGRYHSGESHYYSKLKEWQVADIRRRVAAGEVQRSLAKEYNTTPQNIWHIKNGHSWAGVK
jgi:Mor family transcriptional regulator